MPISFGSSGGGQVMYAIFLNAFEWAFPMNAYPSMPTPISVMWRYYASPFRARRSASGERSQVGDRLDGRHQPKGDSGRARVAEGRAARGRESRPGARR